MPRLLHTYGLFALLIVMISSSSWAQISNERCRNVLVSDTVWLDTLSLVPGSIRVVCENKVVDPTLWTSDAIRSQILFLSPPACDSVQVCYRVLPFRIQSDYSNKTESYYSQDASGVAFRPYRIGPSNDAEDLFTDDGIQKSGSISRGINFGNAQNLSVNSSLNLQLSGRITERYRLMASVSDDNIPIQPQGNTQQLQDFDQVFIQLYDDHSRLIAGDFILKRPSGYFMNYFKRAQGAYVFVESPPSGIPAAPRFSVEASASVSKGRFARNVIQGIEGIQGPYRLVGDNLEPFIIVLAGTEAVYIDGKLLERGLDKDYTIDYNAAEIVFTPRQFITKDRRIVVEFQYSDKRYARPMLQASVNWKKPAGQYFLNVFSEHDARNQPLQQELTDTDKRVLASAGDDPLRAVVSGVDSTSFQNNQVMYQMVDSLGFDSVLRYSTNEIVALYRAVFTLVGSGNGDYVEDGFTANGRKFRWIAPQISGADTTHFGNYAPVILLVPPRKRQMISGGGSWLLPARSAGQHKINTELALTVNDQNTFSELDAKDDLGYAGKVSYQWKNLNDGNRDTTGRAQVTSNLSYEFTSESFARIERFREVEFERNWNVLSLLKPTQQHLASFGFTTSWNRIGSVGVGAESFHAGSDYAGYKGNLFTRINTPGGSRAVVQASWLESSGQINSSFIRHKSDLSQRIRSLRLGFRDEHEFNRYFTSSARDTLRAGSYQFYDWEVSLSNADTTTTRIQIYYRDRIDELPNPDLSRVARADQYGLMASRTGEKGNRFLLNVSNRRLRILDPERFTQAPENTLLIRTEYYFRWLNGFIQGNSFYEVGSGLEQRREFIYLEVPAGQGTFVWNDYNGDNIKDLNEFEIAQFSYEANYIRSFVQTNDYIRTFSNQFSQSFQLNPSAYFKNNQKGWRRMINRFSDQASFRIERKTTDESRTERLNPFASGISDTSLIALGGSFRNVVFFNKSNPTFGCDYTIQQTANKSLLSNGFESRRDRYQQAGVRWNFIGSLTLLSEFRRGQKLVSSDFLSGRNYNLDYLSVKPRISWQSGTTRRLAFTGEYTEKENRSGGNEYADIRKLGLELTLNSPEKGLAEANIQFYSIRYTGEANTSLAFDMLEGLVPGFNFTWGAGIQRTLARSLQLNLSYNGRKPEGLRTIHSGGIQLRAFF